MSSAVEEATPPVEVKDIHVQLAADANGARRGAHRASAVGGVGVDVEAHGSEVRPLVEVQVDPPAQVDPGLRDCRSAAETRQDADKAREEWEKWRKLHTDDDLSIEGAVEDEKKIVSAFLAVDADDDGEIDAEELLAILLAIGIDTNLEAVQQVIQKVKAQVEAATNQLTVHVGGLSTFVPIHEDASDEENLGLKKKYEKELRGLMTQFGEIQTCNVRIRQKKDIVDGATVEKCSYGLVSFRQAQEAQYAIGNQHLLKQKKPEWADLKITPLDERTSKGGGMLQMRSDLHSIWHDPKHKFMRTYTAGLQMQKHSGSVVHKDRRAVADPASNGGVKRCDERNLNVAEFVHLISGSLLETLIGDSDDGDEQKDLALLEANLLEHHADALKCNGLLGNLKGVTVAKLRESGFDATAAVALHKAGSLSPLHRVRNRLVRTRT
jgi:hypothetical protein